VSLRLQRPRLESAGEGFVVVGPQPARDQYRRTARADLMPAFLRRAYWLAPGVRQLLAWARRRPALGKLVARADAMFPRPASEGWLDDVLPAKAAAWLRGVCDDLTGPGKGTQGDG